MRVLLTGATGLIGQEIGRRLQARGDEVVALVRNPSREKLPFAVRMHAWSHTVDVPSEAFDGVEAVIHLAGAPVAEGRWSETRKKIIFDSRVEGTQRLVRASAGKNLRAFVHGSAVGGPDPAHFLSRVVEAWEGEAKKINAVSPQTRLVIVRTAMVLAREGGALKTMLPVFRLGLGARLGDGKQLMPWIHIDDIAGIFLFALDNGKVSGVLEGTAPELVTNSEWTSTLCKTLGVIQNIPVPAFALKLVLGEMSSFLLGSVRSAPEQTQAAGFRFQHPKLAEALQDVLAPKPS